MKAHVKVNEWSTGGFHVERHARCRCGEVFTHYNRGEVNRMFKEHQSAAAPPDPESETR